MEVVLFLHTHWDREWYKPFQEFRIHLCEVMDLLFDEFSKNNIENFYLDGQTIILEDYLEIHPEKACLIKDLIKNKKLFIGPWYVLADEFLVCGESFIRNLLIGINQAKSYGCVDFFGYLPDSFGHNSQIPKILNSFGMERAVLWRGAGNKNSEFIWNCADNSSVLTTYLVEGYFQDVLHADIPTEEKIEKIKEILSKIKSRTISEKILLPAGGDHLGPVFDLKNQLDELNKKLPEYNIKQGRIEEYFSSLKLPEKDLEVVNGELRDNSRNPVLSGTFSSRMYLKQMNAASSWKLSRIAEPLLSFLQAAGLAKNRKNELDYAWKLLLKNHPHDSICGCSVDEVHEENISRFKQINQISNSLISRSISKIAELIPKNKLLVCNLSNYEFNGVVSVKTSEKLPESIPHQFIGSSVDFPREIMLDTQRTPLCEDMRDFYEYLIYVKKIPSFSIKPINTINSKIYPEPVKISINKISNFYIEISVNPDGSVNLMDLKNNRMFKNLHIIIDRADLGDTYNYSPLAGDKPVKAVFRKTEILEKGALRGILKLYYDIEFPQIFDKNSASKNTQIITEISVTAGSKRAEFKTFWENSSENHLLQIKFNLPEKVTQTISEDTFGLIKRDFNPAYRIENHIPAEKGKELKTNSAPMQRFVFLQGLGIITEGLCEYTVSENSLYTTLLRAVGKLSANSLNTRAFPAGPPLNTFGAQCFGKHTARYALCPAENSHELFKEADEFMGSVFTEFGRASQKQDRSLSETFINCDNDKILVYAVKIPENKEINGTVLRLFNISDDFQKVKIGSDIEYSKFIEVNSLEEPLSEKIEIGAEITFKPHELKTLLFLNYEILI